MPDILSSKIKLLVQEQNPDYGLYFVLSWTKFCFADNSCLTSLQWIIGGCGVVTLEHFCLQCHEGHGKVKNRRFQYFENPYSKRRLNISMKTLIQFWKNFSDRKSDSQVMAKYVKTGSCYVISLFSSRLE